MPADLAQHNRMTRSALAEPHAKSRLHTLDAFRGIAILSVMLYHLTYRWGPLNPDRFNLTHFKTDHDWFALGQWGVQFFFIISGFVIFMTLERCRNWSDFAIRRFARLYPTYIACMLITFFVARWLGPPDFHRSYRELLVGFSMLSEELGSGWIDGSYWSLLMEIVFYFWIGVCYFSYRKTFVLNWAVYCYIARQVIRHHPDTAFHFFATPFLCYFTIGMAFYSVYAKRPIYVSAILFATSLLLYRSLYHGNALGVHLLLLGMAAAFALFVAGKLNWLGGSMLGFVGLISYPLYLLHQSIGVGLVARFNAFDWLNGWPAVALASAIVIAIATMVHYAIELPSQKWVRHFLERLFRKAAFT